jgi:hypothetical protein
MYKMQRFMRQTLNWDFTLLTQNLQRSVANPAAVKWENKVLPLEGGGCLNQSASSLGAAFS